MHFESEALIPKPAQNVVEWGVLGQRQRHWHRMPRAAVSRPPARKRQLERYSRPRSISLWRRVAYTGTAPQSFLGAAEVAQNAAQRSGGHALSTHNRAHDGGFALHSGLTDGHFGEGPGRAVSWAILGDG